MKRIYFILLFFVASLTYAQVGIGTATPSDAAMLEVDGGNATSGYRGFMPPVLTEAQRDLIPVTTADVGMQVFINDTVTGLQCLQYWTGTTWICANDPATSSGFTVFAAQDFDANASWTYVSTPAFYNESAGTDVWDVVGALEDITGLTGNFLGGRDLENTFSAPVIVHELAFDNVDVSAATAAKVSFDYEVFDFDGNDYIDYEVYYDDVLFTTLGAADGAPGGASFSGTETINVPGTVSNVRITILMKINGNNDKAGVDNFRVFE